MCVYIYIFQWTIALERFIEELFFPTGFEYIIVPFDRRNSSSENIVAFVKIKIVHLIKKIRFTLHSLFLFRIWIVKLAIILKILKLMIYKNDDKSINFTSTFSNLKFLKISHSIPNDERCSTRRNAPYEL